MGLNVNSDRPTYVNISKGRLFTKDAGQEAQYFASMDGAIVSVSFKMQTFKGETFEVVNFEMIDNADQKFILQMRTDSGYFRGFVNSLRSGYPMLSMNIAPFYKEKDDKVQSTIFVKQNGKTLKHFYTKEKMGDLPLLEKKRVKGKDVWNSEKQITFWKNWLTLIRFDGIKNRSVNQAEVEQLVIDTNDGGDDLPF